MSNLEYTEDFEALLNEYMPEKEEKELKRVVSGKIIGMDRNYSYIDIPDEPFEARVRTEELSGKQIGDEIEILILSKVEEDDNLYYIASKKRLDMEKGAKKLQEAYEKNEFLRGKIVKKIKGGYVVELLHQQGFLPNSLSEIPMDKGESFIGKEVSLVIKEIKEEKRGKKILLSRKEIVALQEIEALDKFEVGQIVRAEVTEVLDFGLTVKVNGIRGFIHISELDWKKTTNLASLYKVGDSLEAKIIEIEREKRNIKLSVKAMTRNPWEILEENYKVGDVAEGKVTRIVNYGAFVEIVPGIEGLLHISDFSWIIKKININNYVKVGDIIKVYITEINKDENRLKLGIKQLSENPWENASEKFALGKRFEGNVIDVKPFGIFVQIEEGVDAFIHNSDFAWVGNRSYNKGDKVEFEVIELDEENQKIKGSIKIMTKSPWEIAKENYKVGMIVEKVVKNIQDFGMFVKLEDGVDGFIPTQLASKDFLKSVKDRFNLGDIVKAEIVEIDDEKHRIKLSIKKVEIEAAKKENRDLIEKYGVSSSEN